MPPSNDNQIVASANGDNIGAESDELLDRQAADERHENSSSFHSGRPTSRKGITADMQPQAFDNNLVSFDQFFILM